MNEANESKKDSGEGLVGQLLKFLELFWEWFFAALHPTRCCRKLLAIKDSRTRMQSSAKLWVPSFVVALIVDVPLYHLYGIELDTLGFHLASLLWFTAAVALSGFVIQLGLSWYKVRSNLADVMSIFACYFVTYQPIGAILSYPVDLKCYAILSSAKKSGADFSHALGLILSGSQSIAAGLDAVLVSASICSLIFIALTCIGASLMALTLAEHYSRPKVVCFKALAFSFSVLIVPVLAFEGLLSTYVAYAFLK